MTANPRQGEPEHRVTIETLTQEADGIDADIYGAEQHDQRDGGDGIGGRPSAPAGRNRGATSPSSRWTYLEGMSRDPSRSRWSRREAALRQVRAVRA